MDIPTLLPFLPHGMPWPLRIGVPACADGGALAQLVRQGHQLFATARDSADAARIGRLAGPEVLVDVAAPAALPWPSHSLDLCVIPADWHGALAELLRVLRPGGGLYAAEPSLQLRTCLALAGISWLDQHSCPGGALLALTQAPADYRRAAAAARQDARPMA